MKLAQVQWMNDKGELVAANAFDPISVHTGDSITLTATFDIPGDTPRIVGPSLICPECDNASLDHRANDYLCPACRSIISDE